MSSKKKVKAVAAQPEMITWAGLCITSVKLTPVVGKGSKVFKFSEADRGEKNDEDAFFIRNVKQISGKKDGEREFEVERLEDQEAFAHIGRTKKHPVFMAHGYDTEAGWVFQYCKQYLEEDVEKNYSFGGSYFIPIIWPSGSGSYHNDEEDAEGAGQAFFHEFDKIAGHLPRKDLITFSMGNLVLLYASQTKMNFDNIFMYSADVPYDLFNTKHILSGNPRCKDGLNIFKMLSTDRRGKPRGKIYVVYNRSDSVLLISEIANRKARLGRTGPHAKRNWALRFEENESITHPEIRPYLVGKDATKERKDTTHRYYFESWSVDFFSKHSCKHIVHDQV